MMKLGLARIVFASFKRPAIAVVFSLVIIILASPINYLYGKAAPMDIAMLTMFLGPLYLILNSILKDSFLHLVMKTRFSRLHLILLINITSFALAVTIAIIAASVYLVRFVLADFSINFLDYLGYFCFEFLFLFILGTIHNFLCEILNNRLIAYFIVFLPVMGEYFSTIFPDAYRFAYVYQAVSNIFMYVDFSIYLFLFVIAEFILFLSSFISREVIDR